MKNISKMLGIIAVLAIIGVFVGCGEAKPEDQYEITITDFPSNANGQYGFLILTDDKGVDIGFSSAGKAISGGSLTTTINDKDGKAFGKNDDLWIRIGIGKDGTAAGVDADTPNKYTTTKKGSFYGDQKEALKKGANSVKLGRFSPDPKVVFGDAGDVVDVIYKGTYKVTYKLNMGGTTGLVDTDEYVDLAEGSFNIYEKKNGVKDTDNFLDFTIGSDGWVGIPVPAGTNYVNAFKFTGYISAGKPVNAATAQRPKNIYGSKTAPGFDQSDITSKTPAWMYLYFNADGTFVRTVFNKDAANDDKTLITGNETPTELVRVYVKQ